MGKQTRRERAMTVTQQTREPSGQTVGAMKDAVAAGRKAVEAVQGANAVMLNALAMECAAREGVDADQFVFNLTTFKWEAKPKA